jgi:hypothetical protein
MAEFITFDRLLWGVGIFLNAGLVVLLLYRKNYRAFPFLLSYAFLNLVQGFAILEFYRIWGFRSTAAKELAWGTQGLVTLARAMAVAEICHRILAKYSGIWQLAWRLLLAVAVAISLYALAVARGNWALGILNMDRGLELAIATVIVLLFLFVRYYEVDVEATVRTLAIGFFLFSCFRVLDDTVFENWFHSNRELWNCLGLLAFLACLLLWSWALRRTLPRVTYQPEMLSQGLYRTLAPEINYRLKTLNENLGQLWYARRNRT